MKVIIPAAGIGKRLRPYTHTKPKPLLNVAGKTIIGHILDRMKGHVKDVVLIVGYQKEKLIESVTENYSQDFNLTFIEQERRLGLGHAIYTARDEVGDSEVLINLGDEIFDINYGELIDLYQGSPVLSGVLGVKRVDKPQHYGIVEQENGKITRLVEKPQQPKSDLALAGVYLIRNSTLLYQILQEMVEYERKGAGGEYQLTDALQTMIEKNEDFTTFYIDEWYDCGRPEMLLDVNRILLEQMRIDIAPDHENSVIIQPTIIGKGCTIKNSIVGPYVSIDKNTILEDIHISDSIVGSNCQLKCLILKRSIIDDEVVARGKPNTLNAGQDSVIDLG